MSFKQELFQSLKDKGVEYPCYLVAYGANETENTNASAFTSGIIWSKEEALELINKMEFGGQASNLVVRVVSYNEMGRSSGLVESIIR